jgi:apolipoprotein N-acyltransferase
MRRLYPALSGALLWLSFPAASLFPLAWVGLVPFLDFILEKRSRLQLLLGHGVFSLLYFGGILYWIPRVLVEYGEIHWTLAVLTYCLMLLLMSLFLLPFTLLTRFVSGKSAQIALLSAPGFWLFTELLRNYALVNGFPWASLGYSQFPYLWIIQVADIGGVYFLSFLIVAINCGVLAVIRFRDFRFGLGVLFLFALTNLYGAYRVYLWEPVGNYRVKAGLVQGNISLAEDREYYARLYFEELPVLAKKAAEQGAQWILLPEAQNPYIFEQDFYFKTFWENQATRLGVFILFNSASFDETAKGVYYNSAYQLDPSGRVDYRYDKVHLVPFGEYLPFADWMTFAEPLVKEVSSFHPGAELKLGAVGELEFGTLICYEAIFPEISRDFVNMGAEILVNLTNDAWFGPTAAPNQHLQMSAFRAIENRKVLLRAANSGYSGIVSPLGRVIHKTPLFTQDLLVAEVEGNSSQTPFSLLGNGFNAAVIMVTFVSLLPALRRKENPVDRRH